MAVIYGAELGFGTIELAMGEWREDATLSALGKAIHGLKESVLTPFVTVEAIGLLFGFDMVGAGDGSGLMIFGGTEQQLEVVVDPAKMARHHITINEVINDIGGGAGVKGRSIKAVQMGGPSGGCIPVELHDTKIDYDEVNKTGAIMGSGGLVVMDDTTCMVDIARFFLNFTQNESCGKCTFCRVGTKRMLEILTRIAVGTAELKDLDTLEELAHRIKRTSLCGLGQTAPNPVVSTMKYFMDEYEAHVKEKRCPAGQCLALMTFGISEDLCNGCDQCALVCPVSAISGELKEVHQRLGAGPALAADVAPQLKRLAEDPLARRFLGGSLANGGRDFADLLRAVRAADDDLGAAATVQLRDGLARRDVLVDLDEGLGNRARLRCCKSRIGKLQPGRLYLLGRGAILGLGRFRQRARIVQLGARSTLTFIEIARTIVIGVRIAPLCLGTGEAGPRLVEPHLEVRVIERRDEVAPFDLVADTGGMAHPYVFLKDSGVCLRNGNVAEGTESGGDTVNGLSFPDPAVDELAGVADPFGRFGCQLNPGAGSGDGDQLFQPQTVTYYVTYGLLIVFFTYFYTAIILNPVDLADNMKKYGGFIPGIRPGKRTSDYIDRILTRVTLPGAIFLAFIAIGLQTRVWDILSMDRGKPFFVFLAAALSMSRNRSRLTPQGTTPIFSAAGWQYFNRFSFSLSVGARIR